MRGVNSEKKEKDKSKTVVRSGKVRTGQVKTDQVGTGQVKSGLVRTNIFLDPTIFVLKIFLDPKCT